MVIVMYVVAYTSRNGDSCGVVYFKIGDTSVSIHKLEGNGNIGYGLAAVVDDAEGDGILFKIDTATATRRTYFGDRHVSGQRQVDTNVDVRIVAGAVARTEAVEVVERVVEVLWSIAPVGRTVVVIVSVVEETTVGSIARPSDDSGLTLCRPKVAIGAIVDHGVVGNRWVRSVVGSNVDIVGGIVVLFDVVLGSDKTT